MNRRRLRTTTALAVAAVVLPLSTAGAAEYDHGQTAIVGPTEAATFAAASSGGSGNDIVFNGRGSYHSVGLSQYGARAQAIAGRTSSEIVRYYYSGTTVSERSPDENIRVGVVHDTPRIRVIGRNGKITVRSVGYSHTINGGTPIDVTVRSNSRCDITTGGAATPLETDVRCPTFDPTGQAEVTLPSGSSGWSSNPYRSYGRAAVVDLVPDQLASGGWRLDVVVHAPLEQYLYGLAEVPYSWEPAALRAQAIAGRSFALFAMETRDPATQGCSCHVWDSQRDQVYKGHDRETSARWADWKAAVDGTAKLVVTAAPGQDGYGDTADGVVQAFYSASSHGRTENKHEVFYATEWDYMLSVDDDWSLEAPNNYYASWSVAVDRATVASKVGLPSVDSVAVTERRASGSAKTVVFRGGGQAKTLSADEVRWTFGLLSNGFGIGDEQWGGVAPPPPSDLFTDDDNSVHESNIDWLANQKITLGCNPPENTRFCPDASVTRGQMAAFLTRALDLPAGSRTFSDSKGTTFESEIAALAKAGITVGCNPPTNDRFCPTQPVTRAQMATFLTRALDLPSGSSGRFTDVSKGSTHEGSIGSLAKAGITEGCNPPTNDRFCPEAAVTRAQMATFLNRALG